MGNGCVRLVFTVPDIKSPKKKKIIDNLDVGSPSSSIDS